MIHSQYHFKLYFNSIFIIILFLIGCTSSSVIDNEIEYILLSNTTQTYTISSNNEQIGTNNITITAIDIINSTSTTLYEESITINDIEVDYSFRTKNLENGYFLYADDTGITTTVFIPFPIEYESSLTGRYGILSNENITVYMTNFHESYTNYNNETFTNVIELSDENENIKVYINEEYFIIQKEDYRYTTTIESLIL